MKVSVPLIPKNLHIVKRVYDLYQLNIANEQIKQEILVLIKCQEVGWIKLLICPLLKQIFW